MFATAWWMETVAPGSHGIALVERDNQIQAAWPYLIRRTFGRVILDMPPLTPWLGVLFRGGTKGKTATRLGREKDLITELIAALPASDVIRARFHREFSYWAPLSWAGFTQSTRYTFVLRDLDELDTVWKGLRDNIRTDVRKATRAGLTVTDAGDFNTFWALHEMTFTRQGLPVPYSRDLVERIDAACLSRGVRRIFIARDTEGKAHAAAYVVWDSRSAYYLMGGGDPHLRSSGATALTLWEAIRFAATVAPVFDFEGSMMEPVERFVRAFGAEPAPYSAIERVTSPGYVVYRALRHAGALLRRSRS